MTPTAARFRALARSSPWRWQTLRFTVELTGQPVVRGWVRRPDRIRVEALDWSVLEAGRHEGAARRRVPGAGGTG